MWQCPGNQALEHHVTLDIVVKELTLFGLGLIPTDQIRKILFASWQWPRHLAHERVAVAIFLQGDTESGSGIVQRSRKSAGQRQRYRAALPLERNLRPAEERRQDVRRDRALKLEVVGDDPGRGGEGLR